MVMGTQAVSPYQQVIEKTKGLAFRSQMLVMNIEKKLGAMNKEVRKFHFRGEHSLFTEVSSSIGTVLK